MSIKLEDLTPEQRKVYDAIMKQASQESALSAGMQEDTSTAAPITKDTPLEERYIEPVHPEDSRRELDAIYARLAEQARAHGGKRETKAEIGTPTSRHGIALDAVLSELTRVARRYPELEPFIREARRIAHEGLVGASSGQGNRIVVSQ